MLRIAICCAGGFSSSALAAHLEKETKEKHLENRASFIFIPIDHLLDRMKEADIAMVCPHMEWKVRQDASKYTIPVTIIPPRLYGLMPATDFIEDAEDLYQKWQEGGKNMITFDDEPRPLAVKEPPHIGDGSKEKQLISVNCKQKPGSNRIFFMNAFPVKQDTRKVWSEDLYSFGTT